MQRLPELTDSPSWNRVLREAHGHLVFDVGANIGQTARIFAPNFDRVVSFEPCEEAYLVLDDEAPPNVIPVAAAVSDHTGMVVLSETARSIQTGQLTTGTLMAMWGEEVGRREVLATTIDAQTEIFGFPDAVKIDTEGHELAVLNGAKDLIAAGHTLWLIEVHSRSHAEPIRQRFGDRYRLTFFDHDHAPAPWPNFYVRCEPT